MQRSTFKQNILQRIMTALMQGALLALTAGVAPNLIACSLPGFAPGVPALKSPLTLPTALAPPPNQSGAAEGSATSIVGLWNVTFYSGGAVVDQGFDAWHSDGTEILNDITDPIEDNVCLGVWSQSGLTYKLKHPSWTFDATGTLTGTAYILEQVTLNSSGNTYTGPYSISFFDTAGNPVGSFTGIIVATRITPL